MTKLEKLICQQMVEQRVHVSHNRYLCSDGKVFTDPQFGKQLALWHEERLLTAKLKYEAGNANIREARGLVGQGYYWLAVDKGHGCYAYEYKPVKKDGVWAAGSVYNDYTAATSAVAILGDTDEPLDLRQWLLTQENLAGLHPHPLSLSEDAEYLEAKELLEYGYYWVTTASTGVTVAWNNYPPHKQNWCWHSDGKPGDRNELTKHSFGTQWSDDEPTDLAAWVHDRKLEAQQQ